FSFNGTNAYVSFPARSNLDVGVGNGFSIECWIKPSDLTTGHLLAEWNDGAGGTGVHLWISIPDYGGLGSIFANLVDTQGVYHYFASNPNVLNTNSFQHIALTYDKTTNGTARIFLNGIAVATQDLGLFTPQTTFGFYLGNRISGGLAGSFYKGLMDEVSLYN